MRIVCRVQQVLVVEFAEDSRHLHVTIGDWLLGMRLQHCLEVAERAIEVQDVEAVKSVADGRVKVQRIAMVRGGRLGDWATATPPASQNEDKPGLPRQQPCAKTAPRRTPRRNASAGAPPKHRLPLSRVAQLITPIQLSLPRCLDGLKSGKAARTHLNRRPSRSFVLVSRNAIQRVGRCESASIRPRLLRNR